MSYPVKRCPFCGHELEDPTTPTVDTAIEKEGEIWRPWDTEGVPIMNFPSVWIEADVTPTDFTTVTDAPDTWTFTQ